MLPKRLRILGSWGLALGSLWAVAQKPLPAPPELSVSDLETQEFNRPDDVDLKMSLAKEYWCQDKKGLAYEHWRWVLRHEPQSPQALVAAQHLKASTLRTESVRLREALCSPVSQ